MRELSDWRGCYGKTWKGEIVNEAFAHPAKYSRALIERVYEHLVRYGWLKAGDTVLDPFAGVALGAYPALRRGINWIGVELEPPFVEWGKRNLDLWRERYVGHFTPWGRAVLLQGDSRRLVELVSGAGALVSSPPYIKSVERPAAPNTFMIEKRLQANYGDTAGQLARMDEGVLDSVVLSPPYAEGCRHTGGEDLKPGHIEGGDYHGLGMAIISSPPYQESVGSDDPDKRGGLYRDPKRRKDVSLTATYGDSEGQLGQADADTFWEAARAIVEQCREVLRPGGRAVWIVKQYVRGGKVVDFPAQWQRLCEACGFEAEHLHYAWLIEDHGTQPALFGGRPVRRRKEHKSFFRKLFEDKGGPRIDYEVVLCMTRS